MTLSEAHKIVELAPGASLDDVKHAYRRLAFALHPDLNPHMPEAGKRFQRLNEAYVLLCGELRGATQRAAAGRAEAEATEKARAQAKRAYARAQDRAAKAGREEPRKKAAAKAPPRHEEASRESVLRDLLRDPFARRVFEDIYSQIRHEAGRAQRSGRTVARASLADGVPAKVSAAAGRMADSVRGWLRRQVDEDQTVYLPGASLTPGAHVRLQVSHGLAGKAQTIELTLPPEFIIGRPVRLKGMGKRLGSWRGDLYLRILPREAEEK